MLTVGSKRCTDNESTCTYDEQTQKRGSTTGGIMFLVIGLILSSVTLVMILRNYWRRDVEYQPYTRSLSHPSQQSIDPYQWFGIDKYSSTPLERIGLVDIKKHYGSVPGLLTAIKQDIQHVQDPARKRKLEDLYHEIATWHEKPRTIEIQSSIATPIQEQEPSSVKCESIPVHNPNGCTNKERMMCLIDALSIHEIREKLRRCNTSIHQHHGSGYVNKNSVKLNEDGSATYVFSQIHVPLDEPAPVIKIELTREDVDFIINEYNKPEYDRRRAHARARAQREL